MFHIIIYFNRFRLNTWCSASYVFVKNKIIGLVKYSDGKYK